MQTLPYDELSPTYKKALQLYVQIWPFKGKTTILSVHANGIGCQRLDLRKNTCKHATHCQVAALPTCQNTSGHSCFARAPHWKAFYPTICYLPSYQSSSQCLSKGRLPDPRHKTPHCARDTLAALWEWARDRQCSPHMNHWSGA